VTVRWVVWAGTDDWRAEQAHVGLEADRLTATGVQLGVVPEPYRLDYRLETSAGWVTQALEVHAAGEGWTRSLRLTRDDDGRWSAGDAALPSPAALTGALDCDLGLSPLTNAMPVLRSALHRRAGAVGLTTAWVSVPDLRVHASRQRYEHLRTTPEGAVVRFSSGDFTADLVVDPDGLVVDYPQLARRVR
jgi:hypothetical protein